MPHFLIRDEPDAYPILFHRLAATLPLAWVEKWPFLPNAILWCVLTAGCALYAQHVGVAMYDFSGPDFGIAFTLFFLTLVSNVSSDMNGINYITLSERLLSRISTGLYFAALAGAVSLGDAPSSVVGVVAGAAALTSSMFARQALIFTTPIVSLVCWNAGLLVILLLGIALAAVIDRSYFFRGLRQMVRFWHAYRNHTVLSRYYTLGHSKFLDLGRLFQPGIGMMQRFTELQSKEPSRLVFRFPEVILFLFLAPWGGDTLHLIAAGTVAASLMVYILTTTKWLRHLGEAIRYIEYNLVVLLPLILAADFCRGLMPVGLLAGYVAWVIMGVLAGLYLWSKFEFPATDRLREALEELKLQSHHTLFTVPFTLGSAICARFPCRALMYQGSAVHLGLYHKFMEEMPYLKRDWRSLAAEHDVTHVVAEKSHLRVTKDLMGWEYDFSSLPVVAETDFLIAYRVDSAGTMSTGLPASQAIEA